MYESIPVAQGRPGLRRALLALACLTAMASRSEAGVTQDGGVEPWFQGNFVVNLAGVVIDVGHRMVGDWGRVDVRSGGRLTAGGVRLYSGSLDVVDPGSFVSLSGANSQLWVGYGRSGVLNIQRGGVVEAASCGLGQCDTIIGGTTGSALNFGNSHFPPTIENGAKGDLIISGAGSRLSTGGTLRLAQAYVGNPADAIPLGVRGGTAAGVVQVNAGGTLVTGDALVGIGPSGPGRSGAESAVGYINIDGAGSSWTLRRNATTGVQAMLTLGAAGESPSWQTTATLGVFNGARVLLDGSSGGVSPGVFLGNGGATSAGYLRVNGAGSHLAIRGESGFLNLGGSAGIADGTGDLLIEYGGQVFGETQNGLVFANVGRNGSKGWGIVTLLGTSATGVRSSLFLSGRGTAGSGAEGQSAFLNVGRGGAGGRVNVLEGALLSISAPATAQPGATTSGAGFTLGRDAGSTGTMVVSGWGSEVIVASEDRRPFAAVGLNGTGTLQITNGGSLQLLAPNAAAAGASNLLYVGGGGNSFAQGTLQIHGVGSRLVQGPRDDNLLIAGGAGSTGSIEVRAGGWLETTGLQLGDGLLGHGTMVVDGGTVLLRGQFSRGTTSGAAVSVGRGGGSGELYLIQSELKIDSTGSFAGLAIGGTNTAAGGSGLVGVGNGARLTVVDHGRVDHSIWVGRAGQGRMDINGGLADVQGAGRVLVGVAGGADGVLGVREGGQLNAGRLLLVGGNEIPLADGSGLVHANDWQPLAANLAAPSGAGAVGQVNLRSGGKAQANHLGVALATGSSAGVQIGANSQLGVVGTAMVGALGTGNLTINGGQATFAHRDASLVVGGFQGGQGYLVLDQGGRLDFTGERARLDIGAGASSFGSTRVADAYLQMHGSASLLQVGGGGSGSLVLTDGAQARAAALLVGRSSGAMGEVWVQGGARLELGSSDAKAEFNGIGLGVDAGASGRLHITGPGTLVRVDGVGRTPLVVGSEGTGVLQVSNQGRLVARAAQGTDLGSVILNHADSRLTVDRSSSLLVGGNGAFVNVLAGQAALNGHVDLQLQTTPMASVPVNPGSGSRLTLPGASVVASADNRHITLTYDGYVPKARDYLPLFAAEAIEIAPTARLSTYQRIDLGGRPGYAFNLGEGQASFRIEASRDGLYPVLERSRQQGVDVWGIRYVDQAVYLDWDRPSSAKVLWTKDARTQVYRADFERQGTQSLLHGAVPSADRDLIVQALSDNLWGNAVATSGQATGNRLGNALALPVFDSRTMAKAPANAVTVRFAASNQRPEVCPEAICRYQFGYDGYAFDTLAAGGILPIDLTNARRDGEVVVVADSSFLAAYGSARVGKVIYHEVGHALGLVHTSGGPADLMHPRDDGPFLSDQVQFHVEIDRGFEVERRHTQNAMYQVLRHTFGWDAARLREFGGEAGSLDVSFTEAAASFSNVSLTADVALLHNVLVLAPSFLGETDGSTEDSWQSLLYLPTATGAQLSDLSFTVLKGTPLRVLAGSAPGDVLDLYFDAGNGTGLAGVAGLAASAGQVMRVGDSGADTVFASYGLASAPVAAVPEPSTALLLLAGGLLLCGAARHRLAPRPAVHPALAGRRHVRALP
jgi:T5SS/PEP-CTERM-associated repeat protein